MTYTIFDLETTGLSTSRDEPVQFAYLEMTTQGGFLKRGAFLIQSKSGIWGEEAEKVHHISRDMIKKYGVDEGRAIASMCAVLNQSNAVTYNGNAYDIPLLSNFICSRGVNPPRYANQYDMMLEWMDYKKCKRQKLVNVIAELGYTEDQIAAMTKYLFGESDGYQAHDARYDVVETMFVLKHILGVWRQNYMDQHPSARLTWDG